MPGIPSSTDFFFPPPPLAMGPFSSHPPGHAHTVVSVNTCKEEHYINEVVCMSLRTYTIYVHTLQVLTY